MLTSTIIRGSDYQTKIQALGSVTGVPLVDVTLGGYVTATSTGPTTWSFTVPGIDGSYSADWKLTLQNGGAYPQAWTNVKWAGGTAPALTASGYDVLGFVHESSTVIRGYMISKDSR